MDMFSLQRAESLATDETLTAILARDSLERGLMSSEIQEIF
jgi:hypothetical protein